MSTPFFPSGKAAAILKIECLRIEQIEAQEADNSPHPVEILDRRGEGSLDPQIAVQCGMSLFRRRAGERFSDILEWIDYRRDANFWPLFFVPPMLSVTWAYGGWIGLGIVVAFATFVAFSVTTLAVLGISFWIAGNALLDVVAFRLPVEGRSTYSATSRSATTR